jgi:hypothetical protein
MNDLLRQLKSRRDDPKFGAVSSVEKARAKAMLLSAIGGEEVQVSRFEEVFATTGFYFRGFVSMPVTVVVAFFVIAFGGSLTTVRASSSLPGDSLYSVKLATERAQLRLASREKKAMLHTEFAKRRLDEATAVAGESDEAKAKVQVAMNGFSAQIVEAQADLEKLREEKTSEASTIASAVDEKLKSLTSEIQGEVNTEEEMHAIEVATSASNTAVAVIVEAHEEQKDDTTTKENAKRAYQNRFTSIKERQNFDLARIERIRALAGTNPTITQEQLGELEYNVNSVSSALFDSLDFAAQSSYRTAFDLLATAEGHLLTIEALLAEVEDAIIFANSSQEEPKTEGTETVVE